MVWRGVAVGCSGRVLPSRAVPFGGGDVLCQIHRWGVDTQVEGSSTWGGDVVSCRGDVPCFESKHQPHRLQTEAGASLTEASEHGDASDRGLCLFILMKRGTRSND